MIVNPHLSSPQPMRKGFLSARAGAPVNACADAADDVPARDGVSVFRFRGSAPLEEEAAPYDELFVVEDEVPDADVHRLLLSRGWPDW